MDVAADDVGSRSRLAAHPCRWGFDVIELPIENLTDWVPGRTRDLLQGLGLGATTCLVMPPRVAVIWCLAEDRGQVK